MRNSQTWAAFWAVLLTGGMATAAGPKGVEDRTLVGWKVHVSKELLEKSPKETARALELLTGQLKGIVRDVPAPAVAELRKVELWISPEYPGTIPKAEYHPDAGWLRENGRDPAMAKAVEFTNVRIFEPECRRMPQLVLHELAHAYHDRVLSFDNAEVQKAFEQAKAGGKYDRVERRDSEGRSRMDRAYAMTNAHEYFAECSEAFFGVNDFYPFNRKDLERQDPAMLALLKKLWETGAKPAR